VAWNDVDYDTTLVAVFRQEQEAIFRKEMAL
jgi:hypothetical protein